MKFILIAILLLIPLTIIGAAEPEKKLPTMDWPTASVIVTIVGTVAILFRDYLKSFAGTKKKESSDKESNIENAISLLQKDIEHLQENLAEVKNQTQSNKTAIENTINMINNQLDSLRKLLFDYVSNGRG